MYLRLCLAFVFVLIAPPSFCRHASTDFSLSEQERESLLTRLSELVSQSTQALESLKEAAKRSREEIDKYKYLIPNSKDSKPVEGVHLGELKQGKTGGHPSHRGFTQVKSSEPASPEFIRNALYATQPVSGTPQATVSVDALENPNDVVKNATEVATFSDDGSRDFFEEELYRMKREIHSVNRLHSLKNNANVLSTEIRRLMTYKPDSSTQAHSKEAQRYEICVNIQSCTELLNTVNLWIFLMAKTVEDAYKRCEDAACRDGSEGDSRNDRSNVKMPPNRKELGRAGWMYLHSMAADFPDEPSSLESLRVKAWCYSFAELYPCHICKEGLVEIYRRLPPVTDSRRDLLLWTHNLHNQVNADLSYPHYNGTYEELLQLDRHEKYS
ncbi:human hepatopoietin-like protein, putative [Babesia bigemina]|uniref:Sulfhydryl oxidase n=1 Tax=Babesia bigemina TaxID=5866 RepID=A0A061D4R7_BABBI|nr:human hepatopoietin-like protein, putative [Babesia bigemina]CDR93944.1 human hepatopoietin-like protein, putative [Babesia bigemina]|eukprot:XP_012766130.1 human hepatopoietin-like protein, putative [Babesia bigemina]